jgi:hypothetical protein
VFFEAAPAAAKSKAVAYPNAAHATFVVDVPEEWTITPGQQPGDYMTLGSPGGVVIQMRTLAGDDLDESVGDTQDYIHKTYQDVHFEEARSCEQNGLKCSISVGRAKEKDGTAVLLTTGYFKLPGNQLGEIWYVAPADDKEGGDAAVRVMNSYRAGSPGKGLQEAIPEDVE